MKEQIHVWIDENLKKEMNQYCKKNETTISQKTRKMWKELLENDNNK